MIPLMHVSVPFVAPPALQCCRYSMEILTDAGGKQLRYGLSPLPPPRASLAASTSLEKLSPMAPMVSVCVCGPVLVQSTYACISSVQLRPENRWLPFMHFKYAMCKPAHLTASSLSSGDLRLIPVA